MLKKENIFGKKQTPSNQIGRIISIVFDVLSKKDLKKENNGGSCWEFYYKLERERERKKEREDAIK